MDWLSIGIGGVIGFIASVGTMVVQRLLDKTGELKLYYIIYCGESVTEEFGFSDSAEGMSFMVPIKLEILNTSNISRIIRDVTLLMYNQGKCIGSMIQIHNITNTSYKNGIPNDSKTTTFGGEKNSYSFVIPPRSIQHEHCLFLYDSPQGEVGKPAFNEIKLRYYDENDKEKLFHIRNIEKCWEFGNLKGDDDWILLNTKKHGC
jgi:hypothetical protein